MTRTMDDQFALIERGGKLNTLVAEHGDWSRIPPTAWAVHDRSMAAWHAARRERLLREITQNGAARGGAARTQPKLRATQPKERDRDHG